MSYKNIDLLIKEKEKCCIDFKNIDFCIISDQDSTFEEILHEIREVSLNMSEGTGKISEVQEYTYTDVAVRTKDRIYIILSELDRAMSRCGIYRNAVRKIVKSYFGNFHSGKCVKYKDLINKEDCNFVDNVYFCLLRREADEVGKRNCLNALRNGELTKLDVISSISESLEGRQAYVYIKGLWWAKIKANIKKGILQVPVIGYFFKWIKAIILLPSYFYTLKCTTANLQNAIYELQEQMVKMENECIRYAVFRESIENLQQKTKVELIEREKEIVQKIHEAEKRYRVRDEKLLNEYQICKKELVDIKKEYNFILKMTPQIQDTVQYVVEKKENAIVMQDIKAKEKQLMDKFYLHYNDRLMLDSRDEVKEREKVYLQIIEKWNSDKIPKDTIHILDLGCGEGEWLELLNDNGYKACGIDSNPFVVSKMGNLKPELGLILGDGYEYLQKLADNSLDIISMFHVIEHMSVLEGIKLLKECYRVLKRGGLLLVETPNPQNILTATYYFRLDPTHRFAIPHELLSVMIEEGGMTIRETLFLNPLEFVPYDYKENDPISNVVFRFNLEQTYAVIAVKGEKNADNNHASDDYKS